MRKAMAGRGAMKRMEVPSTHRYVRWRTVVQRLFGENGTRLACTRCVRTRRFRARRLAPDSPVLGGVIQVRQLYDRARR